MDTIPAIDLLFGSDAPRKAMDAGEYPRDIADAASKPDPGWGAVLERIAEVVKHAER